MKILWPSAEPPDRRPLMLVTYFDAFSDDVNITELIAKHLKSTPDVEIILVPLKTEYLAMSKEIDQIFEKYKDRSPYFLHLGEYDVKKSGEYISFSRSVNNYANDPDRKGNIAQDIPTAYEEKPFKQIFLENSPLQKILEKNVQKYVTEAAIPKEQTSVELWHDANYKAFVCSATLAYSLQKLEKTDIPCNAAFVHFPDPKKLRKNNPQTYDHLVETYGKIVQTTLEDYATELRYAKVMKKPLEGCSCSIIEVDAHGNPITKPAQTPAATTTTECSTTPIKK